MNPISYGRQHISDEDIKAVVDVLKSDYLTQGPSIAKFEKDFAEYVGSDYAVAVSNGTAALHLSALALGCAKGQKVITTPLTFAASANCIRYCGAEPFFVDIDPETYILDINKVRQTLKNNPKGTFSGIIPVDFAGYPINAEEFRKLADEYGLWIIEDACHAPKGGFVDSQGNVAYCGSGQYSDLSIFSFHPVKHIATGEGGMITTNSKELYEKLCLLRTHGITKNPEMMKENHGGWYYEMVELGYNYRLSDMQAALGISQLKRSEEGVKKRQLIAEKYNQAFKDIKGIKTPFLAQNIEHAYHLYVIQIDDRKGLHEFLRDNKIFAQVHYEPVHLQPYYKNRGWKKGDCPIAEAYYEKCISLPMFPTLTEEQQDYVINKVTSFIK